MCEAVASTDWAKNIRNGKHVIRGLSSQMVGNKLKEFGITTQTKPGARGRASGSDVKKVSRADKAKGFKIEKYKAAMQKESKGLPERYQRYAELALEGNVIAACKLKCGVCMGYTGAEKACDGGMGGTPCPLYVINRMIFSKRLGLEANKRTGFFELVKAATDGEVG